ncbi:endonuclease domain-containing protein [Streptomyces sp. NPDC051286]|uniref:endonuclease domain-containing protein n=1 Tax=Streptomyces sp. NPDC051286 TaxID=3365647 RepID=UPI003792B419
MNTTRRIEAALLAAAVHRPTVPWGADYQRRPIGGPATCQKSGRYWTACHGQPHRGPQRPFHGPLTETWTRPGRVPRWYVWWRLWGEQSGTCAICPGPAEVVDHCHTTGLVRALLCYDCNHTEALHAVRQALGLHSTEQCWFQAYWDDPPAARHRWYWPYENRSTTHSFLTAPPAWAAARTTPAPWCTRNCRYRIRGVLGDGVLLTHTPAPPDPPFTRQALLSHALSALPTRADRRGGHNGARPKRGSDGPGTAVASAGGSVPNPCAWCGKQKPESLGATPRKYCRQACRQRAYEERVVKRRVATVPGPWVLPYPEEGGEQS